MRRICWPAVCIALLAAFAVSPGAKLEPAAEFVHEDAKGKLAIIGNVAVALSGDDEFLARITEDVIAISLLARGIKVVYPEQAWFGKPRDTKGRGPVDLARAAGANVLVTGTLVSEPPERGGCDGKRDCPGRCRSSKLAIASLSVVDIPFDKTLVWALYEPENPVSASALGRAFVERAAAALK